MCETSLFRRAGITGRLAVVVTAAAFGSSFHYNYNNIMGVHNNPPKVDFSSPDEDKALNLISYAMSIFSVGGLFGAMMSGFIADKLGRKKGLLLNNVPLVVGVFLYDFSKACRSYEMLIAGRFFIGFHTGVNTGLVPMYLVEISPRNLRGAVATVYQLAITIFVVVQKGFGLENSFGTSGKWQWLLSVTVIPSIFQVCTLAFCPESPKFIFLNKGNEIKAQEGLMWLRGRVEVQDEIDEMRREYEEMKSGRSVTLKGMFTRQTLRTRLIISCTLMLAQQWCGISAITFFSTKIFTSAGFNEKTLEWVTLGIALMNVIITFVSLVLVEKVGRKPLLLFGLCGMCIDLILLFFCIQHKHIVWVSYVSILLVLLFFVFFASGIGSIPWFFVSELLNQSARPVATSIALVVNWTANFILGFSFIPILGALDAYVFIMFAVILVFFIVFTYFKVPETKGKTVEEISSIFTRD